MLRVACIGDSHFDESSRFEECVRIHDWIADDMRERGVGVVLHAGDVYEGPYRSTERERLAVADWLQRVAEHAPVILVKGNHDPANDLPLLERLETRHPISVFEGAGIHLFDESFDRLGVACLAWPKKAQILATTQEISSAVAAATGEAPDASELLRGVLRYLGESLERCDGPKILLAHAMVRAATTSTGQPLVGCDFELGQEDLALAKADFAALGHIHLPQDYIFDGRPIVYTGSPRRTNYGETEIKSYTVAEFDGPELRRWYRVPTPATPMLHYNAEYGTGVTGTGWIGEDFGPPEEVPGAEIRLRYHVDADRRDEAKAYAAKTAQRLLDDGAIDVKVEEVVRPTTRARAPEVAAANTTAEKLTAYWKSRNEMPDEKRATRLLDKLHQLEEAVQ